MAFQLYLIQFTKHFIFILFISSDAPTHPRTHTYYFYFLHTKPLPFLTHTYTYTYTLFDKYRIQFHSILFNPTQSNPIRFKNLSGVQSTPSPCCTVFPTHCNCKCVTSNYDSSSRQIECSRIPLFECSVC